MTDLEKRAEAFRKKHIGTIRDFGDYFKSKTKSLDDLIAEIKWARENPPNYLEQKAAPDLPIKGVSAYEGIWQAALDHIAACLGEK